MDDRFRIRRRAGPRLYHGWRVVAAAFLVAAFGFGLGFYGPGVYLVALQARHGWSTAELSAAITTYYVLGATLLLLCIGPLFDRLGVRLVVATGTAAMACGLVVLSAASRSWQVYGALAVMSLGWATMSGAGINIIVAPWFERRRGLALGWAMNGASAGGAVIVPLLLFLLAQFGFALALDLTAAAMVAVLMPLTVWVLRPKRPDEYDPADVAPRSGREVADQPAPIRWGALLRSKSFLTISVPFAVALTAQVGLLTHQIAFLSPKIGTIAAGWAVTMTTAAAVVGRLVGGLVADRCDRRSVAAGNFLVQAGAAGILAAASTPAMLYLGCLLFGSGVGNATSLPGLIIQREFPRQHFSRIVSLVVAINQFSFAFGPSLLGQVAQARGGYPAALRLCLAMLVLAATLVLVPVVLERKSPRRIQLPPRSAARKR